MSDPDCFPLINTFQPFHLSDEEMINSYMIRQPEFDRILDGIRKKDPSDPAGHILLTGKEGSGKTFLLRRIKSEFKGTTHLNHQWIVLYLGEEQAGIYKMHDFWDHVIQEMKRAGYSITVPDYLAFKNNLKGFGDACYRSIKKCLESNGQQLLLLVDNIDRILDNLQSEKHLFSKILEGNRDIFLIAGSTRTEDQYWLKHRQVFKLFTLIKLEPLNSKEWEDTVKHWGKCSGQSEMKKYLQDNSEKLNVLHVLTEMMPRTLLTLLEMPSFKSPINTFECLRFITDRATPMFREKLNSFPPAQRKIILELSFLRHSTKVRQLIKNCKMPGKVISAQLNQLVNVQAVTKKSIGKDNQYQLSDRFFNLWLVMTQGREEQIKQLKYLIHFLEAAYDKDDSWLIDTGQIKNKNGEKKGLKKKHYRNAIEKGSTTAKASLAWIYYCQDKKKEIALDLIDQFCIEMPGHLQGQVELLLIKLWSDHQKPEVENLKQIIAESVNSGQINLLYILTRELLVHKQYDLVRKFVNKEEDHPEYGSVLKPFGAVLDLLTNRNKKKLTAIEMDPELKTTIELIKKQILDRQEFYHKKQ